MSATTPAVNVDPRFGGIARLYGAAGLERLHRAHVCVIGIGGVGSWAVEALARSGVGTLTLVDLDDICATNINRQIHALDATIGAVKVNVMAGRVQAINPDCRVMPVPEFFTAGSAERILSQSFDCVVDAIDDVGNKCLLLALCRAKLLSVISCGAAGGRRDATAVRVADLSAVTHDRLLSEVRRRLRREHGFPRGAEPFSVNCVFSTEAPVFPQPDCTVCATRDQDSLLDGTKMNCNTGFGSAAFVTGTFGFAAAGLVLKTITSKQ